MRRPLGRPSNLSTERLTIKLPHDIKLNTAIIALEQGVTISALVEKVLRDHIAAQMVKR